MRVERTDLDKAFDAIGGPQTTIDVPQVWDESLFEKPQHWFLSEAFKQLDSALPGSGTAVALEVASKRIQNFWYSTMVDTLSAYGQLFQGQGKYDGGWIDFNGAKLRVTVQPIEGPVDGTIYTVERMTPTEEGSLEFFLDEAGLPEEAMHPMKVVGKTRESQDDDFTEEYTATFRQGRIEKLERVEHRGDYSGQNPPVVKKTEFDLSHIARFLVRPRP